MCPPAGALWILCSSTSPLTFGMARIAIAGWFGIKSILISDCVSAAELYLDPRASQVSNVAAGQKVEGPVLAAVGRLKLVAQAELPLVLQLQPDDGLTQGASVLADHAESGTCGHHEGKRMSELEY